MQRFFQKKNQSEEGKKEASGDAEASTTNPMVVITDDNIDEYQRTSWQQTSSPNNQSSTTTPMNLFDQQQHDDNNTNNTSNYDLPENRVNASNQRDEKAVLKMKKQRQKNTVVAGIAAGTVGLFTMGIPGAILLGWGAAESTKQIGKHQERRRLNGELQDDGGEEEEVDKSKKRHLALPNWFPGPKEQQEKPPGPKEQQEKPPPSYGDTENW
mmetsp:Transcript_8479/g.13073  ORF Transcript_8479/g.13073 Transcript_8479/m.13073 type:complete len:212 (-) Transcript_8479:112-747(-)